MMTAVVRIHAQDRGSHHSIGLWGAAGYSGLMSDVDSTSLGLGYGASAGVMYEFQKHHFIINLGVGFQWQDAGTKLDDIASDVPNQRDDQNDMYTLRYRFKDRTDRSRSGSLQVPLMLGAQFGGFYFLAGAKANLQLMSSSKTKADVTTMGVYDQFVKPFIDMDNHGFRSNVPVKSSGDGLKFNTDISASVELGWVLGARGGSETGFDAPKTGKIRYRLGVYADYGLMNIHQNESLPIIELPAGNNIGDIKMNHIFATNFAKDKSVVPINVGVKFTVLFGLPHRGTCIRCDDY
ncbi:MAG: outer membrane beta-barrel protein [Paludibacteraceae bacterium]|nr:outer membrane beta-barrel protein [Paludibacteraceae bacterium]